MNPSVPYTIGLVFSIVGLIDGPTWLWVVGAAVRVVGEGRHR